MDQGSHEPCYFALKEMGIGAMKSFEREFEALQRSFNQGSEEKHLINLLLAIRHGERHFLVFEWADASLDEMIWDKPHEHERVRDKLGDEWMANQFHGIALAIRHIHGCSVQPRRDSNDVSDSEPPQRRDYGRHGDIKTRNILWFSKRGEESDILVLADLGLTRYHSLESRSKVPWAGVDGHTPEYRPPEADIQQNIGYKYDIWSLGCVFLQTCIWYIEGLDSVREFLERRHLESETGNPYYKEDNFFNIVEGPDGRRVGKVKPAIKQVGGNAFTNLTNESSCPIRLTCYSGLKEYAVHQIALYLQGRCFCSWKITCWL